MASSKIQALWNHPAGPKTKFDEVYWAVLNIVASFVLNPNSSFGNGLRILTPNWPLTVSVHFWAPTFKWGISIANIADFAKPPENLSYPQQIAVTATGVIWSRYSTVINPKNWNLFSVNVGMAGTGIYQLSRKIKHDYFSEDKAVVAKE